MQQRVSSFENVLESTSEENASRGCKAIFSNIELDKSIQLYEGHVGCAIRIHSGSYGHTSKYCFRINSRSPASGVF